MIPAILFRNTVRFNLDNQIFVTADKSASDIGNAGGKGDIGELFAECKGIAGEPFHIAGNNDFLQVLKRFEAVLYGYNGFRNLEFRDTDSIEIVDDFLQPGGNMKPFNIAVALKSGTFQQDDAVRQIHGGQMITGYKRAAANLEQTVRECDLFQIMGTVESEPADSCNTLRNDAGLCFGLGRPGNQHAVPGIDKRAFRNSEYGIPLGNPDFSQAVVCKSSFLNIGNAGRDGNLFQPVTIVKRIRANGDFKS